MFVFFQCHSHTHPWVELGFHLLPFVGGMIWAVVQTGQGLAGHDTLSCIGVVYGAFCCVWCILLCMVHFVVYGAFCCVWCILSTYRVVMI
jgi:hypothetical protein